MIERERLEKAILDLEAQRATFGDESVDTALTVLHLRRAALEEAQQETPSESVDPSLTSERNWVTILFVDISGFTSLAETMDPEAVRNLVNACFDHLVPVTEKYGGTVTKFIGNCIESVFGAPVAHENDPERALRCALEVMEEIEGFNSDRSIDLDLHIGVNTGLVVAGGIGSNGQRDCAVTGDAINLAAWLEDASERGEIFVGPDTYRLTASTFAFETLEPIKVQGNREPVPAYRLVGLKDEPQQVR